MASQKTQKESDSTAGQSNVAMGDPVEDLCGMLRAYAFSDGFKELQGMRTENVALRKEVEKLQTSYNTNLAALAKREADLQAEKRQRALDLAAEKERLKQALDDKKRTLRELKDEQSKSASTAAQLQDQEQRLQGLITQVKHKEGRIQALEAVEADKNRLRVALAAAEQTLQSKSDELAQAEDSLATVQSFIIKLEPVGAKSVEM